MIIKEYILFSDEQKHQANTVDLEDYLLRRYDEQQKMIAETKDFIERFKGTYSKTLLLSTSIREWKKR